MISVISIWIYSIDNMYVWIYVWKCMKMYGNVRSMDMNGYVWIYV